MLLFLDTIHNSVTGYVKVILTSFIVAGVLFHSFIFKGKPDNFNYPVDGKKKTNAHHGYFAKCHATYYTTKDGG